MNDNVISFTRLPVLNSFLPSPNPLEDKYFPNGLENRIKLLIQGSLCKKDELINRLAPITGSRKYTYHNFALFVRAAIKDALWLEQNIDLSKSMIIRLLDIIKKGPISSSDWMALTSLYDQILDAFREDPKFKDLLEREVSLLSVSFETGRQCKLSYFKLARISEYFKQIFDTSLKESEDLSGNILKIKEESHELAFLLFESIKDNSLTLFERKTSDETIKDIYELFFLIDKYQFDENVLSLLEMAIWNLWESKSDWHEDLAVNLFMLCFKMPRLLNRFLKYFEERQTNLLNEVFNCLIEQTILYPHAYEKFLVSFVQNQKVYPLLTEAKCERLHELSEQGLADLLNLIPEGIETLKLSHCEFDRLPQLARFRKLAKLKLAGFKKLKNLEGIELLKNLTHLRLEGCIALGDMSKIQGLSKLSSITAINCPLKDETLESLVKAGITLKYTKSFETDRKVEQLAAQKKLKLRFQSLSSGLRRNSLG